MFSNSHSILYSKFQDYLHTENGQIHEKFEFFLRKTLKRSSQPKNYSNLENLLSLSFKTFFKLPDYLQTF